MLRSRKSRAPPPERRRRCAACALQTEWTRCLRAWSARTRPCRIYGIYGFVRSTPATRRKSVRICSICIQQSKTILERPFLPTIDTGHGSRCMFLLGLHRRTGDAFSSAGYAMLNAIFGAARCRRSLRFLKVTYVRMVVAFFVYRTSSSLPSRCTRSLFFVCFENQKF